MKNCSVEVCSRTVTVKGLCPSHYQRSRRGKSLDAPIRKMKKYKKERSCSKCYKDYFAKGFCQRHYVQDRRRKNREKLKLLIGLLGGKCVKCKTEYPPEVYDFHHINKAKKSFTISKGFSFKWSLIKKEAEKCELLCANCHRIEEAEIRKVERCEQDTEEKMSPLPIMLSPMKVQNRNGVF